MPVTVKVLMEAKPLFFQRACLCINIFQERASDKSV